MPPTCHPARHAQVNLDYESEADMIEKFRIGLALQPLAVALFAASPFREGRPAGELSTRSGARMHVDASRTGGLPFKFESGMSFERYVDYAMDAPMYYVYRRGWYVDAMGMSWRDFMEVRGWAGGAGSMDGPWAGQLQLGPLFRTAGRTGHGMRASQRCAPTGTLGGTPQQQACARKGCGAPCVASSKHAAWHPA